MPSEVDAAERQEHDRAAVWAYRDACCGPIPRIRVDERLRRTPDTVSGFRHDVDDIGIEATPGDDRGVVRIDGDRRGERVALQRAEILDRGPRTSGWQRRGSNNLATNLASAGSDSVKLAA